MVHSAKRSRDLATVQQEQLPAAEHHSAEQAERRHRPFTTEGLGGMHCIVYTPAPSSVN